VEFYAQTKGGIRQLDVASDALLAGGFDPGYEDKNSGKNKNSVSMIPNKRFKEIIEGNLKNGGITISDKISSNKTAAVQTKTNSSDYVPPPSIDPSIEGVGGN
jgi:hypothetical protein